MDKNFTNLRDLPTDTKAGDKIHINVDYKADNGGDLSTDTGVDLNNGVDTTETQQEGNDSGGENLNNFSKEYGQDEYAPGSDYDYDMYNQGAEVQSPLEVPEQPETNDYTGGEYDLGTQLDDSGSSDNEYDGDVSKFSKDTGVESADATLENFTEDNWSDLSLDDQKQSMTDLADVVSADLQLENPPEIVFRDDMEDGSYGGYNPDTNTMEINQNMLDDSNEAADTVAHELWHAYQQQCANDPSSEKGQAYREGFDNYITPDMDFEGYQDQMVEAEARDYAQGYKDRIASLKGA